MDRGSRGFAEYFCFFGQVHQEEVGGHLVDLYGFPLSCSFLGLDPSM